MRQCKESWWYFGENWVFDQATKIDVSEPRVFPTHHQPAANLMILSTRANKLIAAKTE